MATIHSLAPETLDHIFECLTAYTKKSCCCQVGCDCAPPALWSAALVCRDWSPHAQRALYGTVYLGNFYLDDSIAPMYPTYTRRGGSKAASANQQATKWLASEARSRHNTKTLILAHDLDHNLASRVVAECPLLVYLRSCVRSMCAAWTPVAGLGWATLSQLTGSRYNLLREHGRSRYSNADIKKLVVDCGFPTLARHALSCQLRTLSVRVSRRVLSLTDLAALLGSSQSSLETLEMDFSDRVAHPVTVIAYFGSVQFSSVRHIVLSHWVWMRFPAFLTIFPSLETL